jgi:MFS family permease
MVAAYATAYAAALVTAGRLGDTYGSRRVFQIGLLLFGLASLGAFAASSTASMIAARAVQGVAGAMLQPQIVAILALRFGGERRGRVFAAYALSQALAGVSGQLLAGWIIGLDLAGWGWRACFLVVLPVLALASLLARSCIDERSAAETPPVDWMGMVIGCGSLLCLIWSLTVGLGRASWHGLAVGLTFALALGLAFVRQQRRLALAGGYPTLPLRLLGQRPVQLALACVFVFYLGLMSFYWLFSVRTQQELGLGADVAGQLFAVYGAAFMLATMASPAIARRVGHRSLPHGAWLLFFGHLLSVVVAQSDGGLLWMGLALALTGLGIGLLMAPLLALVTASTSAEDAGALAGTVGTVQSAANALGTAIIPAAYVLRDTAAHAPGAAPSSLGGYATSLLLLAGLAVLLAVLSRRAGAAAGP